MKKNFYLAIALLGFSVSLNAQTAKKGVGIKTDTPQTTLDVRAEATDTSMPDGVLVPRLTVTELNAKSAVYGADQNGALVFVTSNTQGGAGTKVENVKDPGFYYYDHATSKWKGVGGGGASIYTANGKLLADRTVDQDGHDLTFNNTSATNPNKRVIVDTRFQTNKAVFAKIRTVSSLGPADWQDDDFIIVVTGGSTIGLPVCNAASEGRIISIANQRPHPTTNITANAPEANSTIRGGKGAYYACSNKKWYTVGGF